jgi:L-threonylcarbamoyladenylate synthase
MKKVDIAETQKVSPSVIELLAESIRKEKTILLPAKTIYGISCSYASKKALERVYEIKKRNRDMPFIVLISKISDLSLFTNKINEKAALLIKRYWEKEDVAPLTLIFEKKKSKSNDVLTDKPTLALRVAEFSFVRQAIERSSPIISTSATLSTIKSFPVRIDQIAKEIIEGCDLVVDVKEELLGMESTIVDVSSDELCIIREGAIEAKEIYSLF